MKRPYKNLITRFTHYGGSRVMTDIKTDQCEEKTWVDLDKMFAKAGTEFFMSPALSQGSQNSAHVRRQRQYLQSF